MDRILPRIARDLASGDALEGLAERLSGSDLTTLLLEVARRRAAARAPSDLMRQWRSDRFVRPSRADPRVLLAVDRAAFGALPPSFEPIELAPSAPLGTCSVVATASQHKIVSTTRGTEVVSDPSNVLALECAHRRASAPAGPTVHLAASARAVRAQPLVRPEHVAHFRLFVTASAGRDPGGRAFEAEALHAHVGTQLRMLASLAREGFRCAAVDVSISADAAHTPSAERAREALRDEWPSVGVALDPARIAASGYYRGVCFGVYVTAPDGARFPLGDGGRTDWTAKLTGSRKERFFVGAIGTELLATLMAPS